VKFPVPSSKLQVPLDSQSDNSVFTYPIMRKVRYLKRYCGRCVWIDKQMLLILARVDTKAPMPMGVGAYLFPDNTIADECV